MQGLKLEIVHFVLLAVLAPPLVFYPVGMFVWSVWSSGHNWPNLPFAYLSALSSASLDGFSVLFAFVCFASENKRNSVTPGWQLSNCVHL